MLSLINELRETDQIEKSVSLPQVVIAGRRSPGKSSVLNAISGLQIPTDDEPCKQFPIEVILRRAEFVHVKAFIRHRPNLSEQRCSDLEAFGVKWQSAQPVDLDDIILDAKTTSRSSACRVSSADCLVLEICGLNQEDLTLIDLPGLCVRTQTDACLNGSAL